MDHDDPTIPLTVRASRAPAAWVLRVAGEVDAATAPFLVERVDGLDGLDVDVDLAEVEFIDSAGLRALLAIRARLATDGRRLTIRRPARQARRLLHLCGLGDLVETPEGLPDPA